MAIVPFDNLTGDPKLDWVQAAAPAILSDQLVGIPNFSLVRSPEARDASLSGATKILHGSVTRQGSAYRIEGRIEDAQSHKFDAPLVSDGPMLSALAGLAKKINAGARPYSTQNEEAGEAWGHRDYEKATQIDPDFGAAWAGWMASLTAQGKPQEALAVAKQALTRATLKTDLTKAQLALAYSSQIKDMPGRRAALNQILKIIPDDIAALATLAEAEGYAHNFPAAAGYYRRMIAKEPGNAGALNGLAYVEAEGGNLETAVKELAVYQKLPNQATNALDSLGEVHFMNGKFKEARQFFDAVAAKDPNFLNGSPVYKSAYAQWLGGDLAGADAAMHKFLEVKKTQGDVAIEWREATWLYVTGRKEEALKKLDNAPADQKGMMDRQRAVWKGEVKPPNDLEQLQKLYETTAPALDGLARVIYARALLSAGKKDQAGELLKRYPLPDSAGDPLLQSLVFPEFLQLRRELNLK